MEPVDATCLDCYRQNFGSFLPLNMGSFPNTTSKFANLIDSNEQVDMTGHLEVGDISLNKFHDKLQSYNALSSPIRYPCINNRMMTNGNPGLAFQLCSFADFVLEKSSFSEGRCLKGLVLGSPKVSTCGYREYPNGSFQKLNKVQGEATLPLVSQMRHCPMSLIQEHYPASNPVDYSNVHTRYNSNDCRQGVGTTLGEESLVGGIHIRTSKRQLHQIKLKAITKSNDGVENMGYFPKHSDESLDGKLNSKYEIELSSKVHLALKATKSENQFTPHPILSDITNLLILPQKEAALKLGISGSMLCKQFKECTRRKWPYRYLRKIDKIIASLKLLKESTGLDLEEKERLRDLLKQRSECLAPVKIIISKTLPVTTIADNTPLRYDTPLGVRPLESDGKNSSSSLVPNVSLFKSEPPSLNEVGNLGVIPDRQPYGREEEYEMKAVEKLTELRSIVSHHYPHQPP